MCGLLRPRGGSVRVLGHDVARRRAAALSTTGIVFQEQTLDLDLSVAQNLMYFAALHGIPRSKARRRAEVVLERMGLAERGRERVRRLNSGHRRRLEIARAMLHEPRFLLLDEPTVGLDIPTRRALVADIHRLCAERALTVLWATHLADEVWAEDDLIVLDRGRVRAAAGVGEVLAACRAGDVTAAFERLTGQGDGEAAGAAAGG